VAGAEEVGEAVLVGARAEIAFMKKRRGFQILSAFILPIFCDVTLHLQSSARQRASQTSPSICDSCHNVQSNFHCKENLFMNKLIVGLLIALFGLNTTGFAQTGKDEIRSLIAEAPFVQAWKRIDGPNVAIAAYWIMLLAASERQPQAFEAARQFRLWHRSKKLKDEHEGFVFLALGLAATGKRAEAINVLHRFPVGSETTVRENIIWITAVSSDSTVVIAEANKIADSRARDDALKIALETFCSSQRMTEARQLLAHFTAQEKRDEAHWLIVEEEKEVARKTETSDDLPTLPALEAQLREAMKEKDLERKDELFDSIATDLAKQHDFRRARLTANQCKNPFIRLSAYVAILGEYVVWKNPNFLKHAKLR
jgi:hypothetical protein